MIRTRTRLALVGIALLSAAAALPVAQDTASAAEHTFVLEQGDRCYEVSPLRGDEDVESFYDYRSPQNHDGSGQFTYSSYMPDHLTREDGSRLFLYEGSDGVSLVMVHNAREDVRDDGSAATFQFAGLPESGDWAVRDDVYGGEDDRFSRSEIDWSWYGDRTDGAAFRGIDRGDTEITVSPAFDEAAALYDDPVERDGTTETWEFLTGSLGDPTTVELDRTEPVTVRTGYCGPDEQPPSAALSGEDGVAGFPVSLDASDSADDRGVDTYRWDFDGDGEAERETDDPTVEHAYDEPGTYNVTVTVVDGGDNADDARTLVTVDSDDPPNAAFAVDPDGTGSDGPVAGFPVTFDASNSTDDVGIGSYYWDFDGDGEVERETTDPTVSRSFEEPGRYDVTLTVADVGGQNATTSSSVSVAPDDPPEPAFRVVSPETPVEGEQVVFDASNSTDDTGVAEYRWTLSENATATGDRAAVTYAESGTYEITLEVIDEGGNDATATREVEVLPTDETPPDAAVSANWTGVESGVAVGFDASDSADDRSVESYGWDFDGDGEVDRRTANATASHAYASAGTYDATVVVADGEGNTDAANVTVEVRQARAPNVSATVPDEVLAGETFAVEGSATDDTGVTEVRWEFGDAETVTGERATYAFESAGTYEVTFTAVDAGGHVNATTRTIAVRQPDETPPTAALAVDANRTETGQQVRFDASDATDDARVVAYRWDFDGDGEAERETANASVNHTYGSAGTYDATVTVVDRASNTDAATVTVEVERGEQPYPGDGDGGSDDGGNDDGGDDDGDGDDGDDDNSDGDDGNDGDGGTGDDGGSGDESGDASGGSGGGGALGPPPVLTETEASGPDAALVDVRNARADELVRADLPAAEVADETGVRFRSVAVALADDDPHFVVETSRAADERLVGGPPEGESRPGGESGSGGESHPSAESLPADGEILGGLSSSLRYLDPGQVEGVTYEVGVERSRLDEAGLGVADLRAFQRIDGAWVAANVTVVERGETVVLRVGTDGIGPVAVGGDPPAAVTDASLAEREVVDGDPIAVTATVDNPDAAAETVAVNLTAGGEVVATRSVAVPADATTNVTLEATLPPGEHEVAVGDAEVGTVTVVAGEPTLAVTDVSVNRSTASAGQPVEIAAAIENTGAAPGERTVALTLFGERVATRTVDVPAGESERVTFVRRVNAPGEYTATVGNESATFAVRDSGAGGQDAGTDDGPASTGVPGFGLGTAAVALLAAMLVGGRLVERARE